MTALGKIVKCFHHYLLEWLSPTKAKRTKFDLFCLWGEEIDLLFSPKAKIIQQPQPGCDAFKLVPFFAVIIIMSLIHSKVEYILILDSGFLSLSLSLTQYYFKS